MDELEIIQHRQLDGLSIFFDTVDYRTPHVHSEWELMWILEEPLWVAFGTQRHLLHPGDLVLFNPNEPHELHKAEKSCTFLCLQISPDALPGMLPVHIDGQILHQHLSAGQLEQVRREMKQIMNAYLQRQDHYGLLCLGKSCVLMHMLLTGLPGHMRSREESISIDKRNARMKRLIRFVDENYMHKIRLADFAQAEGCSLGYLSRFIKDTMNQTFQEYVTSVRFNCACKLMAAGDMRMLDVCMESGFSDYRYFSREFQRQYGMTPEEYSRHMRQRNLEAARVRQSLHSMERFYSRQESLKLAEKYLK